MTETSITFPCDYPIKVVGDVRPNFHEEVFEVVAKHDPTLTSDKVSEKTSRKGNYVSISFVLLATGESQLKSLFEDLKEIESVRLVL